MNKKIIVYTGAIIIVIISIILFMNLNHLKANNTHEIFMLKSWENGIEKSMNDLKKNYPDYDNKLKNGYDTRFEVFINEVNTNISMYEKHAAIQKITVSEDIIKLKNSLKLNPTSLNKNLSVEPKKVDQPTQDTY